MQSIWIEDKQLERATARNEAFWAGELEEYPLLWITVPPDPASRIPEPADERELWLDTQYVIESALDRLGRTYYLADTLPVHHPWLGPDQFAAWLGGELEFDIRRNYTSWITPFVEDWEQFPEFKLEPQNKWWMLYLEQIRASAEAGKDKWAVAYPDLHCGIDALSAMRGPDRLSLDLLTTPDAIQRAMGQMTGLYKEVIDTLSPIILAHGQGSSNWTSGWSAKRFGCIGQNDYSCMVSPEMFRQFILEDTVETTQYVDRSIYHLDGPGALRHLPDLLRIERLDAVQWVPGAGHWGARRWMDVLRQVQAAGKGVTMYPCFMEDALACCQELDISRLFLWMEAGSPAEADEIFKRIRQACAEKRGATVAT